MVLLSALFTSHCSGVIDRSLSPPEDTAWVNVEVKNPSSYTKPFPLKVVYISHKCLKSRTSGVDGSRIEEPAYNGMEIPLQQQGNSNIWSAKVARAGGGSCHWTLSEFKMGIEYIDATHLEKDLVPSYGVGAIIAFDSHATRNGRFSSLPANGIIAPKYYPYIIERKMNENRNYLTLLGEEDFLSYRSFNIDKIVFLPEIDERKIVRYIGIKKKVEGAHSKIIYPDGSVDSSVIFPSFDKVDKMQVK
ncbi:hypothetical protein ACI2JI_12675 [Enterobacter cancerogenus]|uniref:hypothetical protein n=1 Tax=Enterobacter cancerogenus TaxID=69218 RepID=UPI00384B868B